MAHGKSQFCGWYCQETGRLAKVTTYLKNRGGEIVKELMMYSPKLRKHTKHVRKDLKKSS